VRYLRPGATTVTLAAAGTALLLSATPALAQSAWTVVAAPPANASLNAVATIPGSTGAWAVGATEDPTFALFDQPIIDSWNGSSWTPSTVPGVPGLGTLTSVSASGASDAWAVGYYTQDLAEDVPVALHWNGSAWSSSSSVASAFPYYTALTGVADISPTDAYATGYDDSDSFGYLARWNGTTWSQVLVPQPYDPSTDIPAAGHTQDLNAISASSADDVWAVGSYIDPSTGAWTPYAEHFNGTAWSVVTLPEPASGVGTLTSVVANSPTDVWAVGYTGPNTIAAASTGTLIEHWNGTAWSIVTSPSPGTKAALTGVTTSNAADNVWAVGHYIPAGGSEPQTLTLNWNGTAWSVVTSPDVGITSSLLGAAASPGTGTVWAVGSSNTGTGPGTLSPLALEDNP
jgi:hypothetical protein